MILFGAGVALLLSLGKLRRAHSERPEILGLLALSIVLLSGYGRHATATSPSAAFRPVSHPNFRASVTGGFITVWAWAECLSFPCFTKSDWIHPGPIRFLICLRPRSHELDEMSMPLVPCVWATAGADLQHGVIGIMSCVRHHWAGHAGLAHCASSLCSDFFSSLQYTSMNTLVVRRRQ